jgi:hypothetical protein
MSDPRRLRDQGDDLARALLRAGRPWAPRPARQRAIGAAASIVATTGLTATTAVGALVKAGATGALKWVGIAALVGGTTVGAAVVLRDHAGMLDHQPVFTVVPTRATGSPLEGTRRVRVPAPEPTAEASALSQSNPVPAAPLQFQPTTVLAAGSAPEPRFSSARPRGPVPRSSSAPASPPLPASPAEAVVVQRSRSDSIAEEVSALKQVDTAIGAGASLLALSLLDGYAARFPAASLGAEAQVLRIEALARSGDAAAARRAGEAFLATNPQSPYRARIRRVIETNP